MLKIQIDNDVLSKLRTMLKSEPEGTCVRLREYTIGAACHAQRVLGPSLDIPQDTLERATVEGITFVADPEFVEMHGNNFILEIENGILTVKSLAMDEKRKDLKPAVTVYADFSVEE